MPVLWGRCRLLCRYFLSVVGYCVSICLSSRRLDCCVDTCISVLSRSRGRLLCRHVCYQVDVVGCRSFRLLYLHVYYQAALVDRSVDICFITYTYQAALLTLVVSRINIRKLCWHLFYHVYIEVALSSLVLSRIHSRLLFRYFFYHV